MTAPASADSAQETDFAARVNALRTSHGLNALVVDQGISGVARNWASRIAANGALSHNPNLANELPQNWTDMGENVAFGPDPAAMERELENDPPHFANLTNPRFTHVGIGIVEVNGRLWGVQDFAGYGGSAATSSPYGQSPYAQSPYAPAYAPASSPPAAAPASAPVASTSAASPAVGALAVSSAAPVASTSADPPPATARVSTVAFTGGRVERQARLAAAAFVVGMVLLTTCGLIELRSASR